MHGQVKIGIYVVQRCICDDGGGTLIAFAVSVCRRVKSEQWKRVQKSFQSMSLNVDAALQACHSSRTLSSSSDFQQVANVSSSQSPFTHMSN